MLDRENGKALLLSRYALNSMEFGSGRNGANWSNSDVNSWLNGDFFSNAFDEEEQSAIIRTKTSDTTDDMVFLLSDSEAQACFADDSARRAEPCAALDITTKDGMCRWWLRTTGTDGTNKAMLVDSTGQIARGGVKAESNAAGVRPAIWIDLTKAGMLAVEPLSESTQAGDTVAFGSYAPGEASAEPVEWLVLERTGNVVTMVSKYLIDAKPYEASGEAKSWQDCSLREWLNRKFISQAFTDAERNALVTTALDNGSEPQTEDWVYLLSEEDINRFFPEEGSGSAEKSKALDAAQIMDDFNWWWLRTKDDTYGNPKIVNTSGAVSINWDGYGFEGSGGRPAIGVALAAL